MIHFLCKKHRKNSNFPILHLSLILLLQRGQRMRSTILVTIFVVVATRYVNAFRTHEITHFLDSKCTNTSQISKPILFTDNQPTQTPDGWIVANCTCAHAIADSNHEPCTNWRWSYQTFNASNGFRVSGEKAGNESCSRSPISIRNIGALPMNLAFSIRCMNINPDLAHLQTSNTHASLQIELWQVTLIIALAIALIMIAYCVCPSIYSRMHQHCVCPTIARPSRDNPNARSFVVYDTVPAKSSRC